MNSSRVTCLLCALLIVRACSPFSKSHTLIVLSAPALASSLPSAFQPTSRTWCVWPSNDLTNFPDGTSNTFTNLSAPQVASLVPSGLKQTPNTVSLWPFLMSTTSLPVGISKTLISPSSVGAPPPVASSLPLPENARATTRSAKPVSFCFSLPVCASQTATSWKLPLTRVLPSGL